MVGSLYMVLTGFLNDTLHEITRSLDDTEHPFRSLVFTTKSEYFPDSRMVILRSFEREKMRGRIFTDYRTHKVQQLKINPYASLLFWHPKKQLQLKVLATTEFVHDPERQELFYLLSEESMKHYNKKNTPGQEVSTPEEGNEMKRDLSVEHFTVIEFHVEVFEILLLDRIQHYKARYEFEKGKLKNSSWLVP